MWEHWHDSIWIYNCTQKETHDKIQAFLDQREKEGWELVNVMSETDDEGRTLYIHLFFKRPYGWTPDGY